MKIVFCLESSYNSGGMERMLAVIANSLSAMHEITVITAFNDTKTDYFKFSDNIKRKDLGIVRSQLSVSKQKKEYRKRLNLYLCGNVNDITISLGSLEMFFLYKLEDTSKKILWFHFALSRYIFNSQYTKYKVINSIFGKLRQKRVRYIASKYNHIIVLTKADYKDWRKKNRKVSYIYNPITIVSNSSPDYSAKKVIAVGRLDYQKGFDYLLEVWKILSSSYPDWKLDIYGSGPMEDELKSLISNYHLEGNVQLCGVSNNISEEYSKHSIFVLSSRYEGLGLVLLEASVCGLPLVSFDCEQGPNEVVAPGKNGFLISPVGNTKEMARALGELMGSEVIRKKMGMEASMLVKKFSLPNIINQWECLLRKVMNS